MILLHVCMRQYDAYTFHQSQHFLIQVAMPPLRVLHCKVLPPKNVTVDGISSVPTELELEKEPEPEKDPAEVQALEPVGGEI